ncbi:MAG: hypothetical protein ACRC46_07405 [Thermoguttaceae bacterium]
MRDEKSRGAKSGGEGLIPPAWIANLVGGDSLRANPTLSLPSILVINSVFGVGTAVPVLILAGVIAGNASLLGRAFAMMQTLDWWTRTITGTLFIVIGIWFSLKYVYGLL